METVQVEIWVVVDDAGEYGVGAGPDTAGENYANEIGDNHDRPKRMVKVTLTVPRPRPVVLTGTVPAEACEGGELRVA